MTLYDIIADLRREHANETASKTLDLVMIELGHSRDNLREALQKLDKDSIPPGDEALLKEHGEHAHGTHPEPTNYPE